MTSHADLKRLATEANQVSPTPWYAQNDMVWANDGDGLGHYDAAMKVPYFQNEIAAYVAACHPAQVLALLEENERIKKACDIFEQNSADAVEREAEIRRLTECLSEQKRHLGDMDRSFRVGRPDLGQAVHEIMLREINAALASAEQEKPAK